MRWTRRKFLGRTAVVVGSAALGSGRLETCRAQTTNPVVPWPIVDTHQHWWDLSKVPPAWIETAGSLRRSFVTKDYLEAIAGLNVRQAVYMEVDVAPKDHVAEAELILEMCRQKNTPTRTAVLGGRPGEEGFSKYLARFRGNPCFKGLRQLLFTPAMRGGRCLDPAFVSGIRLLGSSGWSFDLCMLPTELADGAALVQQCPGTRFVLDHCGNGRLSWFLPKATAEDRQKADVWRSGIGRLAKLPNVVCKISGIISQDKPGAQEKAGSQEKPARWTPEELAPVINHCLDTFGPDRVMYASDWPVCTKGATLRQWTESLGQIVAHRSEAHNRKLFAENALRFYGLDAV